MPVHEKSLKALAEKKFLQEVKAAAEHVPTINIDLDRIDEKIDTAVVTITDGLSELKTDLKPKEVKPVKVPSSEEIAYATAKLIGVTDLTPVLGAVADIKIPERVDLTPILEAVKESREKKTWTFKVERDWRGYITEIVAS